MTKPEVGFLQAVIELTADKLVALVESTIESVGPFGEPVSTAKQMAAFDDMQPLDWLRMTEERGPEKTEEFLREMLRRKALSEANRRPI